MREEIKKLFGKNITFFDKNGGVRNILLEYQTDWWNVNDIQIVKIGKKNFEAMDLQTHQLKKYRYNEIMKLHGDGITFKK